MEKMLSRYEIECDAAGIAANARDFVLILPVPGLPVVSIDGVRMQLRWLFVGRPSESDDLICANGENRSVVGPSFPVDVTTRAATYPFPAERTPFSLHFGVCCSGIAIGRAAPVV